MSGAHKHSHKHSIGWQKVGLSLSIACSIHCLLMPFVIAFLPSFGMQFLGNVWLEALLLGSSFLLASITLFNDYRRQHNKSFPLLILFAALVIVIAQQFFPAGESVLAPLSGLVVFGAYSFNWHLSRRHNGACEHESHIAAR